MSEPELFGKLALGWTLLAVLTLPGLLLITIPYGRHAHSGWGPRLDGRLGWFLNEVSSPVVFVAIFVTSPHSGSPTAYLFLALWLLHYLNRAVLFPLRMRSRPGRMPVVLVASGFLFNGTNAWLNATWLFAVSGGYPDAWLGDPRLLLGGAAFLLGFAINVWADETLRGLRGADGPDYKIPRGGLYRWVSCPNYLGEILEWTGWAIATWSVPGLAFALWTAVNLAPRARSHHLWYRERFADYPSERRALLPGLW